MWEYRVSVWMCVCMRVLVCGGDNAGSPTIIMRTVGPNIRNETTGMLVAHGSMWWLIPRLSNAGSLTYSGSTIAGTTYSTTTATVACDIT